MSQMEVYDVLKNKRLSGIDRYFSSSQIARFILDGKVSGKYVGSNDPIVVNRDLKRLKFMGVLESTRIKNERVFRISLKCLSDD